MLITTHKVACDSCEKVSDGFGENTPLGWYDYHSFNDVQRSFCSKKCVDDYFERVEQEMILSVKERVNEMKEKVLESAVK